MDYIRLARIDHWFKNIFMLPGSALALILADVALPPAEVPTLSEAVVPILIGVLSTCLLASANYVINEWLDAEFDRHHPLKQSRSSVRGMVRARFVYLEYLMLIAAGLSLASLLSREFIIFSLLLLAMGILYNVRPFRSKDRAFLDVLTESINNPIRLLLGWSAVIGGILPPSSILLAYWMGGAFLMAMKRYAEYRFIDDSERAGLYRRSFRLYSEEKLLLSSFFYALCSAFFLGVFLVKYRIEFLLSFPLFALLFAWYLHIAMKPHSASQTPEKLYREPAFMAYIVFLVVVVALLFFVDIPQLQGLMDPYLLTY